MWWVLIFLAGIALAQQPANPFTFEVASIRPSPPDAVGVLFRPLGGGGLRVTGATLKNLIFYAYGVREFLVSGGPGWVETERFDIEGRAESSPLETAPTKDEERERIDGFGIFWPSASNWCPIVRRGSNRYMR